EAHAEEDRRRAESVETRNHADQLAYQAEKALKDAGDKVPADLRTEMETKVKAIRDAIAANDNDAIKRAHDDLQASISKIGEAVYAQTGSAPGGPGPGTPDGDGHPGAGGEGAH
ncbi:MAG: molecular chaperone DnaK, partial [Chloroflexi bacterium]